MTTRPPRAVCRMAVSSPAGAPEHSNAMSTSNGTPAGATEAPSRRTRIERSFDPEAVRELKRTTSGNLSIGGPHLAAQAFAAGLVDEVQLFVSPVVVGGGTKFLPDNLALSLELKDEYAFRNGVVYLGYTVKR